MKKKVSDFVVGLDMVNNKRGFELEINLDYAVKTIHKFQTFWIDSFFSSSDSINYLLYWQQIKMKIFQFIT